MGCRARRRFPEPVPGLRWPDVLAVESGVVADAVRAAWQGWWESVLRVMRETACLARRHWFPDAWERPVPVTETLCAFLGELLQIPAPAPRDVVVGRGAVACRARDAGPGRVVVAVVRAECPEEVAGLVPGLERFAGAAGGAMDLLPVRPDVPGPGGRLSRRRWFSRCFAVVAKAAGLCSARAQELMRAYLGRAARGNPAEQGRILRALSRR